MTTESAFSVEGSTEELNRICGLFMNDRENTVTILQEVQNSFGYVPQDAVTYISGRLEVPESRFYGVATFYSQFYLNPRGKNIITCCSGTACHVKGSDRIISRLQRDLGLDDETETTADLNFTLEKVNCVGACSIAPVTIINRKVYGKSTPDKMSREVKALMKEETE